MGKLERDLSTPESRRFWKSVDDSAEEGAIILAHKTYKQIFMAGLRASDVFLSNKTKEALWKEYVQSVRKETTNDS